MLLEDNRLSLLVNTVFHSRFHFRDSPSIPVDIRSYSFRFGQGNRVCIKYEINECVKYFVSTVRVSKIKKINTVFGELS